MKKRKKVFRVNIKSLPVDTVTFKDEYYTYALIACNSSYIEPHIVKSLRNIVTRTIKKYIKGNTYKKKINKPVCICPLNNAIHITGKGLGGRMGRGKGAIRKVSALLKTNDMLFKFRNVSFSILKNISTKINYLSPSKSKVFRFKHGNGGY